MLTIIFTVVGGAIGFVVGWVVGLPFTALTAGGITAPKLFVTAGIVALIGGNIGHRFATRDSSSDRVDFMFTGPHDHCSLETCNASSKRCPVRHKLCDKEFCFQGDPANCMKT